MRKRSGPQTQAAGSKSTPADEVTHVAHRSMSQFNQAFALMSVLPLLISIYLVTVHFLTIEALQGRGGFLFLVALIIALGGMLVGRRAVVGVITQLVNANANIEQMYRTHTEFVNTVAHDFRSPLAVVKGSSENLEEGLYGPMTKDQLEALSMSQRQIKGLVRLAGDLLDISHIESGKLRLIEEEVSLREVVQSVAEAAKKQAKDKNLDLIVKLAGDPAIVTGDRDRLGQVLTNLLSNAIKYTEKGMVAVKLTSEDTAYKVEISDTGPGIAAGDHEKVFDKYGRAEGVRQEGVGLGLPIAKQLIEMHHGSIWVESEVGKGSHFFVKIPARKVG